MASSWGTSWAKSWANSWGTVGGITPPPVVVPQRGAGAPAGKRRKRLVVEIDGKEFAVNNEREAVAVLRKAKDRIKQEVKARVAAIEREPAAIVLPPARPRVEVYGDDDLREQVAPQIGRFWDEVDALFAQANLRMQEALAEQDDEEIFLLL